MKLVVCHLVGSNVAKTNRKPSFGCNHQRWGLIGRNDACKLFMGTTMEFGSGGMMIRVGCGGQNWSHSAILGPISLKKHPFRDIFAWQSPSKMVPPPGNNSYWSIEKSCCWVSMQSLVLWRFLDRFGWNGPSLAPNGSGGNIWGTKLGLKALAKIVNVFGCPMAPLVQENTF